MITKELIDSDEKSIFVDFKNQKYRPIIHKNYIGNFSSDDSSFTKYANLKFRAKIRTSGNSDFIVDDKIYINEIKGIPIIRVSGLKKPVREMWFLDEE